MTLAHLKQTSPPGGGGQPWRVVINISVVTTRAEVPQVAPTFGELFGVPQVPRGVRGREKFMPSKRESETAWHIMEIHGTICIFYLHRMVDF